MGNRQQVSPTSGGLFNRDLRKETRSKEIRNDPSQHLDRRRGCNTERAASSPGQQGHRHRQIDVQPSVGQTDATVKQSAEMGKADDVQDGKRQECPEEPL